MDFDAVWPTSVRRTGLADPQRGTVTEAKADSSHATEKSQRASRGTTSGTSRDTPPSASLPIRDKP